MAAIHAERHPQAGRTVKVRPGVRLYEYPRRSYVDGSELEDVVLEDWADRLLGDPWRDTPAGRPIVLNYLLRADATDLPIDDDVVGIRVNGLSHMVHVSELAE
ncbi:hypothetical protein [Nocardiopsis dassonvillei]|uniref:hypothetical protein n=1 Tax=Nocardiopsis dassonvillei TaxID=2014 RepID=UPI00363B0D7D